MYHKGQKIHNWTIVDEKSQKGSRYVFCQCICGTLKSVLKCKMKNGISKSCGCKKTKNLNKIKVGDRFGEWLVRDIEKSKALSYCLGCEEVTRWISIDSLVKKRSRSCGCKAVHNRVLERKQHNQALIGKIFGSWKVLGFSINSINSFKCLCLGCNSKTQTIRKDQLESGKRKSCGCQKTVWTKKTMKERYGAEFISQTSHHKNKMIQNNIWTTYTPESLAEFKIYHKRVWNLTEQTIRAHPNQFKERGPDYHVDHILSIAHGFRQKLDPEVVSSIYNLRILEAKKNWKKNLKSDISKEDLLRRYNEGLKTPELSEEPQCLQIEKDNPMGLGLKTKENDQ